MNIYDFDKTVYINDSSVDFFKYCLKLDKRVLRIFPRFLFSAALYYLGFKKKEYMKNAFFAFFRYFDDIEKTAEDFWKSKNYKLKDFYMNQMNKTDVIVSASPEFMLQPVAKKYGIKIIGTIHNLKTGEIIGNNCFGEEKVNRLKKINISKCKKFYSDSLSDTPASKLADEAFIVRGEELIPWNEYSKKA